MNATFKKAKIMTEDGIWLCLKVNEAAPVRAFVYNMKDRLYDLVIKEHREKRSLDANAYCWVLIGKLAGKLGISPEDVYRHYIPDVAGNYAIVPVKEDRLAHWDRIWCSDHLGRMTKDMGPCRAKNMEGYHNVMSYFGSSDYDTKQMARLIDLIIQDCKVQDIETLPPDKLALLKEEWGCTQ